MPRLSGIILAAGMGTRLGGLTSALPKALVPVDDLPLISYAIAFQKRVGVQEIHVIGGFEYAQLAKVVRGIDSSIILHQNAEYTKGNLYSLLAALPHVTTNVLLMNVDHIYHKDIAEKVSSQLCDYIQAFTDTDRSLADDDMKVETDAHGRYVRNISKQLTHFTHGYVGMSYIPIAKRDLYQDALAETIGAYQEKAVVENVLQILAQRGDHVRIGDISGAVWHEVDFPHERNSAEEAVVKNPHFYV